MNNNSYVYIPYDKLMALIETGCPPISRASQLNSCIGYDGNCKECWKSWLAESEDGHE